MGPTSPRLTRRVRSPQRITLLPSETGLEDCLVFVSGCSGNTNDLLSVMAAKRGVGLSLDRWQPAHCGLVAAYVARGGAAFIDTGAFSAFRRNPDGSDLDFPRILSIYKEVVDAMAEPDRGRLVLMGPDAIGDGQGTLELVRKYRGDLLELIDLGADLALAAQLGLQEPDAIAKAYTDILGTDRWRLAIPCNACAMPPTDVARIARSGHRRYHWLGISDCRRGGRLDRYMDVLRALVPGFNATADSNRLVNIATREKGRIAAMAAAASGDHGTDADYFPGQDLGPQGTLALQSILERAGLAPLPGAAFRRRWVAQDQALLQHLSLAWEIPVLAGELGTLLDGQVNARAAARAAVLARIIGAPRGGRQTSLFEQLAA